MCWMRFASVKSRRWLHHVKIPLHCFVSLSLTRKRFSFGVFSLTTRLESWLLRVDRKFMRNYSMKLRIVASRLIPSESRRVFRFKSRSADYLAKDDGEQESIRAPRKSFTSGSHSQLLNEILGFLHQSSVIVDKTATSEPNTIEKVERSRITWDANFRKENKSLRSGLRLKFAKDCVSKAEQVYYRFDDNFEVTKAALENNFVNHNHVKAPGHPFAFKTSSPRSQIE